MNPRRIQSGPRRCHAEPPRAWVRAWCLCASALACGTPPPASAQIFGGPQHEGGTTSVIVLSNFRSELTPQLLIADMPAPQATQSAAVREAPIAASAMPMIAARRLPVVPPNLTKLIATVATEVQLAPALLHAVIAAESAYDPQALSVRGAMGLMQLMPATATRFGARNAYAPRENLLAGALYLKWLLATFDGDLELALAAYNAGEQAVIKAGRRIPPYPETRAYVPRVLGYLRCASDAHCDALRVGRAHPLAHGGAPAN